MALNRSFEEREKAVIDRARYPPESLQIGSFRNLTRRGLSKLKSRIQSTNPVDNNPTRSYKTQQTYSHPTSTSTPTTQEPHFQPQSPLFTLPPELRFSIYRDVLSGSNIHITGPPQRLGHLRCNCTSCPGFAARPGSSWTWIRKWECDATKYSYDSDRAQLGLLGTCRRVYVEACELVYGGNTFSFDDADVLRTFLGRIGGRFRACLDTVHVDAHGAWPLHTSSAKTRDPAVDLTEKTWDALAGLTNLRTLEIRIHPLPDQNPLEMRLRDVIFDSPLWRKERLRVRLYVLGDMILDARSLREPFEVSNLASWEWMQDHPGWSVYYRGRI